MFAPAWVIATLSESYGYHILLVVLIYFFSTSLWFNRPVELQSPFDNTTVEHYALSEYLPPINTGPRGEAKPRKGAAQAGQAGDPVGPG